MPSVEGNSFFGYSSSCIIFFQENNYHRGCLHENFLLHCQIKARPCRWRNRQHKEGAACRLLFCNELVEFILRTRDQRSTTQPEGHSTDLCLLSWTVLWISDSLIHSGQHHYAPLVPGVIKRHLLFTSALPSCTPRSNNPVSSGLWSVEMQKTVQLISSCLFVSFFIFSCLSFFRQPAEISDAESMKLPMLKVNALTSSLAQNSPSCFVNYFHNIVYFTSSLAWGRDNGAIWLQNLKL